MGVTDAPLLALFGRRLAKRMDRLGIPAFESLHNTKLGPGAFTPAVHNHHRARQMPAKYVRP